MRRPQQFHKAPVKGWRQHKKACAQPQKQGTPPNLFRLQTLATRLLHMRQMAWVVCHLPLHHQARTARALMQTET
jgi:hypothetical protein